MLAVTILGNNSAIPAFIRHPTAQVVQTNEQSFLLDCGEGTQMQMERYRIRHSKINHVFISHLHGDHYFGLIGLLTSMALQGRKKELHLYAPATLKTIIDLQLKVASAHLSYELHFHALEEECTITDTPKITIECFRMHHRIECWGFLFKEKKNLRKINPDEVKKYKVPPVFYDDLHQGKDFVTEHKTIIKNELLTTPSSPAKTYAFCGDTIYYEEVIDKIKNVDLLSSSQSDLAFSNSSCSLFSVSLKDAASSKR
jgi:ribonuclease Z